MRTMFFPRIAALPLAWAGALALAALSSSCAGMRDDAVARELHADAAAIAADKAQLDLDAGNPAALTKDKHQLYLDTEKQEHDRGTEDDEMAEGEWP